MEMVTEGSVRVVKLGGENLRTGGLHGLRP